MKGNRKLIVSIGYIFIGLLLIIGLHQVYLKIIAAIIYFALAVYYFVKWKLKNNYK